MELARVGQVQVVAEIPDSAEAHAVQADES